MSKNTAVENSFRTVPIKLSDNTPLEEVEQRVQLMRTCTFFHQRYGKVEITRQLFSEMIENFEKNTRGIDVMIDYAHDSEREAAGWVKSLELTENPENEEAELWATVEWTPKGRKVLSDKEFAYLSADFDPDYKDNENPNVSHGAVLLGAGLTNRPVIKRMKPAVQLSEYSEKQTEEKSMDNSKELTEKLSETEKKLGDSEARFAEISKFMEEMGVESIEALMEMIREMKSQNTELGEAKELAEKEQKLTVLFSEGKITQAQKEKALKLEKAAFDGFVELAEMNEKSVKLSEEGDSAPPKGDDTVDVETKVMELAEAKAEEKKIDTTEAISIVLSENKELAKKYYNR